MMRMTLAAWALFSLLAQKPSYRTLTLVLPHALRGDETVTLIVTLGVLPRGDEVKITTTSGRPLGVISPYGIRTGQEAGTYVVPLPSEAISGRRLSLRLSVNAAGRQRAPAKNEVKRVRVEIERVKEGLRRVRPLRNGDGQVGVMRAAS
jgi:hypothetical protein